MMIPSTPVPATLTPKIEAITLDERELLIQLLFTGTISRNQQFEQFEEPQQKRLHRISKHLKAIHRELQRTDGEYWVEDNKDDVICLHIHRPNVGLVRKVFLSPTEWELLQHPMWDS